MRYKRQVMHIRLPEIIHEDLKNLASFKHCSMNQWILQAVIEKIEREQRYFLNNEIPRP